MDNERELKTSLTQDDIITIDDEMDYLEKLAEEARYNNFEYLARKLFSIVNNVRETIEEGEEA